MTSKTYLVTALLTAGVVLAGCGTTATADNPDVAAFPPALATTADVSPTSPSPAPTGLGIWYVTNAQDDATYFGETVSISGYDDQGQKNVEITTRTHTRNDYQTVTLNNQYVPQEQYASLAEDLQNALGGTRTVDFKIVYHAVALLQNPVIHYCDAQVHSYAHERRSIGLL